MSDVHRSGMDRKAAAAVTALEKAVAQGEQLGLFGAEPGEARKRNANKTQSAVSKWLAAQGYTSPIEAMARHAGLHIEGDAAVKAMAMVDVMEAWATRGECSEDGVALRFSPAQRMTFAGAFMAEMRKASEALAPYTAKRLSPDVKVDARQQLAVVMPSGTSSASRYVPPPMPSEKTEQNQKVIEASPVQSENREFEE